jgi:hypothetical protein
VCQQFSELLFIVTVVSDHLVSMADETVIGKAAQSIHGAGGATS